ncbi:hypothetical protein TGAM01_v209142 [Trichoderma gamsii]|uniref:Cyclin-D1-binding protein 1-like N-terminal domain-containing protein n=1 Tax=Trichoderma gamsii TaxID=398673 RepID=A0A0W7VZI7_9HYPO|nr:hypothetical protein TGAM01_v209142 [Trichoderma gamsii]PNP45277.1 hypothetical protein TGAMA5MH_03000 [Trichoderma gamsii]PON22072.1 hypothetical protein TGAM01_v209142 [Trichoderma gamsii]
MAPVPDATALKSLETLIQTAGTLLKQLQDVLGEIRNKPDAPSAPATSSASTTPLNALALARDSATLIRAHATKVSLLIINEPFTPSAVSSVVRELVKGPIPGLAASVQACDPNIYTLAFRRELASRCQRVMSGLAELLAKIPKDGKVLAKDKEGFGAGGKGSIASTGVLWSACDSLAALANGNVSGFFVQKMNEWKDTLNDIMEEVKEWGDEEADEDDEDEDDAGDDDVDDLADAAESTHISTQNMLDDLMSSHQSIPASDPDGIRPRLESSLRRLRLVIILYTAITKRRMKNLPSLSKGEAASNSTTTQRLNELAPLLQKLPDSFGDLAGAFYELRPKEIDDAMDQCFLDSFAVSELLSVSWDGSRDEFTEWTEKFQKEIKRA